MPHGGRPHRAAPKKRSLVGALSGPRTTRSPRRHRDRPAVEAPFWRIPRPYQPAFATLGGPRHRLDQSDLAGCRRRRRFTSARAYARVSSRPRRRCQPTLPALGGFDEAIAAQAAKPLRRGRRGNGPAGFRASAEIHRASGAAWIRGLRGDFWRLTVRLLIKSQDGLHLEANSLSLRSGRGTRRSAACSRYLCRLSCVLRCKSRTTSTASAIARCRRAGEPAGSAIDLRHRHRMGAIAFRLHPLIKPRRVRRRNIPS